MARAACQIQLRDSVVSAGEGSVCEDRCGIIGNVLYVIDGATQIDDRTHLPHITEGAWIADTIVRTLHEVCLPRSKGTAVKLLKTVSESIRTAWIAAGPHNGALPPTCSISLVVLNSPNGVPLLDVASLGDTAVCIQVPGMSLRKLYDDRFCAIEQQLFKSAATHAQSKHPDAMKARRAAYISSPQAPRVLSTDPRAVHDCLRMNVKAEPGTTLVAFTDGAMRAINLYSMYHSLEDYANFAVRRGAVAIIQSLREHESSSESRTTALKQHDDAAIIVADVA